jgi:hypothetical protein
MEKGAKIYKRSDPMVALYMLDGVCAGLRQLVPNGLEVNDASRAILTSIRNHIASFGDGVWIRDFPDVNDQTSSSDLLIIAETLRAALAAFLTPEELEERAQFGFATPN